MKTEWKLTLLRCNITLLLPIIIRLQSHPAQWYHLLWSRGVELIFVVRKWTETSREILNISSLDSLPSPDYAMVSSKYVYNKIWIFFFYRATRWSPFQLLRYTVSKILELISTSI